MIGKQPQNLLNAHVQRWAELKNEELKRIICIVGVFWKVELLNINLMARLFLQQLSYFNRFVVLLYVLFPFVELLNYFSYECVFALKNEIFDSIVYFEADFIEGEPA